MTDYDVSYATMEDVQFFAANMRASDRNEAIAQTGMHPSVAIGFSFGMSEYCRVGRANGVPVVLFGVARVSEEEGSPWMVATNEIKSHAITFIKMCPDYISEMHSGFSLLKNYVDVRNKDAIRWLKAMGFTILEPVQHGTYNMMFHPFYMSKVQLCVNPQH